MEILQKINEVIINPLILLLFGVAILVFLWGVAEFILSLNSDDARSKGKQHMLWGVIGLVIMFSVWAIIQFLGASIDQFA